MSSKIAAMQRIAAETDRRGGSSFPSFMRQNMEEWKREGLVTLSYEATGNFAMITDKGRALAKKAMA